MATWVLQSVSLGAMEGAWAKGWYGWVRTSTRVRAGEPTGQLEAARMYTGRYRPRQCGHKWYLPKASHSCHYLFRPPVDGTPKQGLVSAAVVVVSKIVLSRGKASLGHPSNITAGRGTPRIPAP